jgi:hypothetical protein
MVCGRGLPGEQAATIAINTKTASHNERLWNMLCLLVIDVAEFDACRGLPLIPQKLAALYEGLQGSTIAADCGVILQLDF